MLLGGAGGLLEGTRALLLLVGEEESREGRRAVKVNGKTGGGCGGGGEDKIDFDCLLKVETAGGDRLLMLDDVYVDFRCKSW